MWINNKTLKKKNIKNNKKKLIKIKEFLLLSLKKKCLKSNPKSMKTLKKSIAKWNKKVNWFKRN